MVVKGIKDMSSEMNNKTSVITGAGSGIGLAIANLLARENSKVYILDNNREAGIKAHKSIIADGGECNYIYCDISEEENVKKAINTILENEKKIDVLVNNAGISHVGNIETTTSADMDRIFNINVKGLYFVTREILPLMKSNGGGVILNLASIAARIGLNDRFAYSMSKGAVLSMTMSIAKDYIDDNIRCNCICPARVHTPFVDDFIKKNYAGRETEVFDNLSRYQPIGRMGQPEEIAEMVCWLCSDRASYVTGASYNVDGGYVAN